MPSIPLMSILFLSTVLILLFAFLVPKASPSLFLASSRFPLSSSSFTIGFRFLSRFTECESRYAGEGARVRVLVAGSCTPSRYLTRGEGGGGREGGREDVELADFTHPSSTPSSTAQSVRFCPTHLQGYPPTGPPFSGSVSLFVEKNSTPLVSPARRVSCSSTGLLSSALAFRYSLNGTFDGGAIEGKLAAVDQVYVCHVSEWLGRRAGPEPS